MKNNLKVKKIEEILKSHPFIPPRLLQSYHAQTFMPRSLPYFKIPGIKPERKHVKLPDGSQVAVECLFQKKSEKHSTIVVLGGFTGASSYSFCLGMMHKAYQSGFNVIIIMQKGWGDTIHSTKYLYTGPLDDDVNVVIKKVNEWSHLKKLYIVGLSYGGYLSLAEIARNKKITFAGAVAISPVVNTDYITHLEKHPLYSKLLVSVAKKQVKRRMKVDPPNTWDPEKLKKITSIREFYDTYKHLQGDIVDFEDYKKQTDLMPYFPKIQVPTLIINSNDDPLSPSKPFIDLKNPNIITLLAKHGGHGGFFTTKKLYGDLDGHWAQNRTMEFINLIEGPKI
jgi:hypothetical protein